MRTENFNEAFFAQMREEEVWKKLSEDYITNFVWTEALLERYRDKVDWKLLSGSSYVLWTGSMLEKFKLSLDWDALSGNSSGILFTQENLRKYRKRWNWMKLSENGNVVWSVEMLEEFKDDIDWDAFAAGGYHYRSENEAKVSPQLIFEKYQSRFSASRFKDSHLWDTLLECDKDELIKKILA
ncbi:MAG: hypothetical protein LBN29_02040 [Mediterranea sp.]|jgi:hypothetical protein|nr:hypothetical protein [Mediterranea sp.]